MSDDSQLDLKININTNQSDFDKLKQNLDEIDQKWNKLAALPPLNIDRKIGSGFSQEQINILNSLGGPSRTGGMAPSGTIEPVMYSQEQQDILNGMGGPTLMPGPGYTGTARGRVAPEYAGMAHSSLPASYFHPRPTVDELMARGVGNNGLSLVRALGPATDVPFSSGGGSGATSASPPPLSYTWDSVYGREIAKIQDPEKKARFLSMMDNTAYRGMMNDPASTTGKYHPDSANKEGGLALHSMTVAKAARELALARGYTGDMDDLTIAGLAHDSVKKNKSGFYNSKHDAEAAANAREYGLYASSEMMATHMYMGKKGQLEPTTEGQKILHEADWLASRKYAEDYMQGKESYDALRSRAIKAGDASMGSDGFLKITAAEANKDQKEITDNAKQFEKSWNSVLSSAGKYGQLLKGLGALGIAALTAGIVATTANNKDMGSGLQTFTGLDGNDIMANQIAAKKIGIGEGSINDAIVKLVSQRGGFKLKGEGELLNKALWGEISSLMTGDQPMNDVFWQIADKVADDVKGMNPADREKQLNLAGINIPGIEYVVDFMSRMSKDGKDYRSKDMLSNTIREGGSGSWMTEAARVNAEMQVQLAGIKDSFKGLAQAFEDLFGKPVLTWFNKALDEVVNGKGDNRGLIDMMAQYKSSYRLVDQSYKLGLVPQWGQGGASYNEYRKSEEKKHDAVYSSVYDPLAKNASEMNALRRASERDAVGRLSNLKDYSNVSAEELNAAWSEQGGASVRPFGMGFNKEDTEARTRLEKELRMKKIIAAAAAKGFTVKGDTPEELIADGKRLAEGKEKLTEAMYRNAINEAKVAAEAAADKAAPLSDEMEGKAWHQMSLDEKYKYGMAAFNEKAKTDTTLGPLKAALDKVVTPTDTAKGVIIDALDVLKANPAKKAEILNYILEGTKSMNNETNYLDRLPGDGHSSINKGNIYISASFPNAVNAREIQSAFTSMSSSAMDSLYTRSVG